MWTAKVRNRERQIDGPSGTSLSQEVERARAAAPRCTQDVEALDISHEAHPW